MYLHISLYIHTYIYKPFSEIRGGSRTAATSKMEFFVIIVNGWKPLTIIIKSSILHVAAVVDPPLEIDLLWYNLIQYSLILLLSVVEFLKDYYLVSCIFFNIKDMLYPALYSSHHQADKTHLTFHHENITEIQNQLNKGFANIRKWHIPYFLLYLNALGVYKTFKSIRWAFIGEGL